MDGEEAGLRFLLAAGARGLGASEYLPKQGEDLNDYITQKTLDGLFAVMREKESALRGSAIGKGAGILGKVLQ